METRQHKTNPCLPGEYTYCQERFRSRPSTQIQVLPGKLFRSRLGTTDHTSWLPPSAAEPAAIRPPCRRPAYYLGHQWPPELAADGDESNRGVRGQCQRGFERILWNRSASRELIRSATWMSSTAPFWPPDKWSTVSGRRVVWGLAGRGGGRAGRLAAAAQRFWSGKAPRKMGANWTYIAMCLFFCLNLEESYVPRSPVLVRTRTSCGVWDLWRCDGFRWASPGVHGLTSKGQGRNGIGS
jgi:hypothetical protein